MRSHVQVSPIREAHGELTEDRRRFPSGELWNASLPVSSKSTAERHSSSHVDGAGLPRTFQEPARLPINNPPLSVHVTSSSSSWRPTWLPPMRAGAREEKTKPKRHTAHDLAGACISLVRSHLTPFPPPLQIFSWCNPCAPRACSPSFSPITKSALLRRQQSPHLPLYKSLVATTTTAPTPLRLESPAAPVLPV